MGLVGNHFGSGRYEGRLAEFGEGWMHGIGDPPPLSLPYSGGMAQPSNAETAREASFKKSQTAQNPSKDGAQQPRNHRVWFP